MSLTQRLQVVGILAVRIAIERDESILLCERAPVILRFEALQHILLRLFVNVSLAIKARAHPR